MDSKQAEEFVSKSKKLKKMRAILEAVTDDRNTFRDKFVNDDQAGTAKKLEELDNIVRQNEARISDLQYEIEDMLEIINVTFTKDIHVIDDGLQYKVFKNKTTGKVDYISSGR